MNIRKIVNRFGFDVVRYPRPNTVNKYLSNLFDKFSVDCVFDVGANEGQYAYFLRDLGYSGTIVSFEPVGTCIRTLEAGSQADPDWHVVPGALGNTTGVLMLNVSEGTDLTSALSASAYGRATFPKIAATQVEVSVQRLDALYDGLQKKYGFRQPFLKMDTQGYDLLVLEGASGCVANLVGLQSEVSLKALYDKMPSAGESLDAIREAGFDPVSITPVGWDARGVLIEVDVVAQRRG